MVMIINGVIKDGYRLTLEQFDNYLTKLSDHYQIYAPVVKKGKGTFSDTDLIGY